MTIFDCNCSYGVPPRPPFRYARDVDELLAEMDFCGIDRALAHRAGMRFDSPVVWNARLVEDLKGNPRVLPTWTILPHQTGEQAEPERFIAMMAENGIRALRAFPYEHRYRLDGRTFGPLFERLIDRRIPLFVKHNAEAIGDLLAEFPDLTVVAVNQGPHSLERYLRPLLDAHARFYLETSHYMVEGLIEEFRERYGPDRLLYGSGFPDVCGGAPLLRLMQADIDNDARAAIAGGNLSRLLSEVRL